MWESKQTTKSSCFEKRSTFTRFQRLEKDAINFLWRLPEKKNCRLDERQKERGDKRAPNGS
jgi:hypothetical protein